MTTEYKTVRARDFKADDAKGTISVAFAQLDVVDKGNDVTMPGAFPSGKAVPMSAYGHTSWDGALPPGRGAIHEEDGWAIFDAQFLMDTSHGRETYQTVKAMADLQEWSYGYLATEYSFGERDDKHVRFLTKLDVYEVSPVLVGMGNGTHTRAIKGDDPVSGLPLMEHHRRVSAAVSEYIDRLLDRASFRGREGRKLSDATIDDLQVIREQLDFAEAKAHLDGLIASKRPIDQSELRRIASDMLVGMLRDSGVTV